MSSLDLVGTDIYLGSYHVATLRPSVYGTLLERVESCLDCADPDELDRQCEETRKAEEGEWRSVVDERDVRINELEAQVSGLESDNESLESTLRALEGADDKATALRDALEEIEHLKDTIATLRAQLAPPKRKPRSAKPVR